MLVSFGLVVEDVWIFGVFLGGLVVVKIFFDYLFLGLLVGFVYVQYIDNNFIDVLIWVLGWYVYYKFKCVEEGDCVYNGDVVFMFVDYEWWLDVFGVLIELSSFWFGFYGFFIDQVLFNVVDYYGVCCYVILFFGMGNDGVIVVFLFWVYGSWIWVQEYYSCGNSFMFDLVVVIGCFMFSGILEELVWELVKIIEEFCLFKGW